jgi:hypothetical protein
MIVLIFLGGGINIVVAWCIALLVAFDQTAYEGRRFSEATEGGRVSMLVIRWDTFGSAFFESMSQHDQKSHVELRPVEERYVPSWSNLAFASPGGSTRRFIEARGWPSLSVWCEYRLPKDPSIETYTVLGGIPTPLVPAPKGYEDWTFPKTLPVRPIWTGMATNTFFYGIGFWCLAKGICWLRSLARLASRRCAKCGYPLAPARSTRCPECGWRRKDAASEEATS